MTEHPILFSGPMVRAILDGRKTQTRRVIKPQPPKEATSAGNYFTGTEGQTKKWTWLTGDPRDCDTWESIDDFELPHFIGDRLWVRESGWERPYVSERDLRDGADTWPKFAYDADDQYEVQWLKEARYKRRPSIHMPRWASRITIEVTGVKVERLQDISEADAQAEGCIHHHDPSGDGMDVIEAFSYLWQSINGPGSWDQNPWVAAYTFRRVKP